MKKFQPKILINPFINNNKNLNKLNSCNVNNKNKIFIIEKIKKNNVNGSQSSNDFSSNNTGSYERKGKHPNIRIKRKDKYKMFNSKFKQECIKMVF